VITAYPNDVLWRAIRTMGGRDIGRLPVVKSGTRELVGMLHRHCIINAYNLGIARKLHDQHHVERMRLNQLTGGHIIEVRVRDDSPFIDQPVSTIQWPADAAIASIHRQEKLIVPHGSTTLQAGDVLSIVTHSESESELKAHFDHHQPPA
jgi:Trk K+ transport system NAD-binding subunit